MMSHALICFAILMAISPACWAASEADATNNAELKMETERVFVFKDGHGLIVKKGTATTDNGGNVVTYEVPDAATLGSFWAIPSKGKMKSMVAGWTEDKQKSSMETSCETIQEIIAANVGKTCSFLIGQKEFQGTVGRVLSNESHQRELSGNEKSSEIAQQSSEVVINLDHPTDYRYFVLNTKLDDVVIDTRKVENFAVEGMTTIYRKTHIKTERRKRLTMQFDQSNTDVTITLMYFCPGIRWIPTYRVQLTDEKFSGQGSVKGDVGTRKVAHMNLQGEVINDSEDFIDTPLHLVVGVPNFQFKETTSPMSLESRLVNVISASSLDISNSLISNQFSNAAFSNGNNGASRRHASQAGQAFANVSDQLNNQAGNDLFVYEAPKISLKKGERSIVPIFTGQVPYRNVYTWEETLTHSGTFLTSERNGVSPLKINENRIWRQVELINSTEMPWTTGPVLFTDGYQPLAQDLLTYTSPASHCRVPVTVAVDIQGSYEDRETGRELNDLKYRGNAYCKVKGKLNAVARNAKKEPVEIEISVRFGGAASGASDDGKVQLSSYDRELWENDNSVTINNSSRVTWKTTLKSGEAFRPSADYVFWIHQ